MFARFPLQFGKWCRFVNGAQWDFLAWSWVPLRDRECISNESVLFLPLNLLKLIVLGYNYTVVTSTVTVTDWYNSTLLLLYWHVCEQLIDYTDPKTICFLLYFHNHIHLHPLRPIALLMADYILYAESFDTAVLPLLVEHVKIQVSGRLLVALVGRCLHEFFTAIVLAITGY